MRDEVRRATAFIGGVLVSGRSSVHLYDEDLGQNFSFDPGPLAWLASAQDPGEVIVTDISRNVRLSVRGGGRRFEITDYGSSAHVFIELSHRAFEGHDSDTGSFFEAVLRFETVELYDYGTSRAYAFTLLPNTEQAP